MSACPEVAEAVAALRAAGVLTAEEGERPGRVARGELVSVRAELRAAFYLGVLLLVSGVGLFLKENVDRIGPSAIAGAVGLAAGACLAWAWRKAAPPTWGEAAPSHPAFDYVLLLGALLAAADLAWVEAQTRLLGPAWPLHLLVVALFYGALAYRFDSRMLLSLSLASFAAWRGLALSVAHASLGPGDVVRLRWEALATGALFAAVGVATASAEKKAHFGDVWVNAGALLVFGGLLSGVFGSELDWGVWLVALLGVSAAVAAAAYRWKRTLPFAQAVLAAYLGSMRAVFSQGLGGGGFEARFLLMAMLGGAALATIFFAHRRMRIP
ncbi:MAG TPA: hypothetical protein PLB01_00425 [Thermoanaerobaculia bacterium]|nr:hypothetical protein [Thermoanaerobaculia bacterium]